MSVSVKRMQDWNKDIVVVITWADSILWTWLGFETSDTEQITMISKSKLCLMTEDSGYKGC